MRVCHEVLWKVVVVQDDRDLFFQWNLEFA